MFCPYNIQYINHRKHSMQKKTVYYTTISSSVGTLFICVTDCGICYLGWDESAMRSFVQKAGRRFSITLTEGNKKCLPAINELNHYFLKKLTHFTEPVEYLYATPFQKSVLDELRKIRYGTTRTYKDIAAAIGAPDASRAVGNAVGDNPVSIIIPCHRVIRTDGGLGGFGGGIKNKRFLLDLEMNL